MKKEDDKSTPNFYSRSSGCAGLKSAEKSLAKNSRTNMKKEDAKSAPNFKSRSKILPLRGAFSSQKFGMPTKHLAIYIKTFGCQMNNRDSEIVVGMLAKKGYSFVGRSEEADVVLFNTCSVRENAENRVWGQVASLKGRLAVSGERLANSLRKPQTAHRTPIIGIIGCMSKIHAENIFEKLPNVDFICAPANIYDIPDLIERARNGEKRISAIDKQTRPMGCKNEIACNDDVGDCFALRARNDRLTASVNIMEGCDNFCSYCVVPYARGRERSRPAEDILKEIKCLIDSGVKDITLLGQNVNSYGKVTRSPGHPLGFARGRQVTSFVKLLGEIDKIIGKENIRVRFVTSHPKDASEDLFKAMKDLKSVCEYLHLPFQSGSDKILSLMNRKYTRSDYLKLIGKLRKILPGCAISTDAIVGFPQETQEDFADTVDLFKKAQFDSAFIFKYSPRPHTAALKYKDDVPTKIKQERNQVLLALQNEISLGENKDLLGEKVEVLVESLRKGQLFGRTRTNKITVFEGSKDLIGRFVDVKIKRVTPHTLIGELGEN